MIAGRPQPCRSRVACREGGLPATQPVGGIGGVLHLQADIAGDQASGRVVVDRIRVALPAAAAGCVLDSSSSSRKVARHAVGVRQANQRLHDGPVVAADDLLDLRQLRFQPADRPAAVFELCEDKALVRDGSHPAPRAGFIVQLEIRQQQFDRSQGLREPARVLQRCQPRVALSTAC